jgi:hypothetical protein
MITIILALLTGIIIGGILISIISFLMIMENKGEWTDEVYFTSKDIKE